MSTENLNDQEVAERAKALSGATNDSQMAEILGIKPQSYHNRKKNGNLWPLILEWGIQQNANLNWLVWGKDKEETKKAGRDFLNVSDSAPSYQPGEMKLGRALEITTRIIQDGPDELRRALAAELYHLDKHLDKTIQSEAEKETFERRLTAVESRLSSATRRAEMAEAKLRRSGGT